jgi:hypothetical protein
MKYYLLFFLSVFSVFSVWAQKEAQQTQKLRYFNHTQVSLLIGEESEDQTRKALISSFQTVNGIRMGEHLGLGVGLGVEPFEYVVYPVFIGGYYFINNHQKTVPYFAMKGGYAFSKSSKNLGHYYYGTYDNKGGVMFNPEIGVRIRMSGLDLTVSCGYRYQRLTSHVTQDNSAYTYNRQVGYKRTSFALGIMF